MKTGATKLFAMPIKSVGTPVFHDGGNGLGNAKATAGKTTTTACRKACITTRWPFSLSFVAPLQYAVIL
jgi:hypothetical protein